MGKTHYGRAIRGMRVARNLTAAQLGRKCRPRLSATQITYMESKASIQLHRLEAVARGLGVQVNEIISFASEVVA